MNPKQFAGSHPHFDGDVIVEIVIQDTPRQPADDEQVEEWVKDCEEYRDRVWR